jgi:hypothetical protein
VSDQEESGDSELAAHLGHMENSAWGFEHSMVKYVTCHWQDRGKREKAWIVEKK